MFSMMILLCEVILLSNDLFMERLVYCFWYGCILVFLFKDLLIMGDDFFIFSFFFVIFVLVKFLLGFVD